MRSLSGQLYWTIALFLFGSAIAGGAGWRAAFPEGGNTPIVATDSADPQLSMPCAGVHLPASFVARTDV